MFIITVVFFILQNENIESIPANNNIIKKVQFKINVSPKINKNK